MAYKASDAAKRHIKEQYERACNAYLLELANMWDLDCKSYGFWVGDEVGGTYSYGDTGLFIDMNDIKYCVENDITYSEYMDWLDYCVWAEEFKQEMPNLRAWHNGCPRVDVATQEKLSAMKFELERLIKETKDKRF